MRQENYRRKVTGCELAETAALDSAVRLLVSVIIPVRDEAKSISSLVRETEESLSGLPNEIIVVDDGSRDETRQIASSSCVTVISHQRNLGKGIAMKTGVQNSSGRVIVFIDGDGVHSPRDIQRVIDPILEGKADLVIGSRFLPESRVVISTPIKMLCNKLASFIISVIISFLLPMATVLSRLTRLFKPTKAFRPTQKTRPIWIKITDCTSGFRAISREGWESLVLMSNRFEVETEMIYEATKNGLVISEVPIHCNWDKCSSRLSIFRDGLSTLTLLAAKLIRDTSGL